MSRIIRNPLLLAVVAVGLIAAAVAGWQIASRQRSVYTDGRTIREPASMAQVRDVLWSPAVALPDSINSSQEESEPCISADGSMLLFVRAWPEAPGDIWFSMRTGPGDHGWSVPQPLNGINSSADERSPALSEDAQSLYFCSNREGGNGGFDIWMSLRQGEAWLEPVNLGPQVNSPRDDVDVATDLDDSTLYFASNRPTRLGSVKLDGQVAAPSSVVGDDESFNVFIARRGIDGSFGSPLPIDSINTEANERSPALSPAGDFLYLASDRADGRRGFDLYRSRLVNGIASEPASLGPTINSNGDELDPTVAMEGFALYFTAPGLVAAAAPDSAPPAETEIAGGSDLFLAISREVYRDREAAWFNLASLARILWPLLWALVALAMILALLALLKSSYARHIGLLARCVIASLLVHCLLMLVFMAWQVSAGIADIMREGGPTRVALITSASKSELSGQLRGPSVESQFNAQQVSAQRSTVETQTAASTPETYELATSAAQPAVDQRRLEQATASDAATPMPNRSTPIERQATTFEIATASADVAQPRPAPQSSSTESTSQAQPAAPGPLQQHAASAPVARVESTATSDIAAPSSPLPQQAVNRSAAPVSDAAESAAPQRSDPQATRETQIASSTSSIELPTPRAPAAHAGDSAAESESATQLPGELSASSASRASPTATAASQKSISTAHAATAPQANLPSEQRLSSGDSSEARESQPSQASAQIETPTNESIDSPRIVADLEVPSDTPAAVAAGTSSQEPAAAPTLVARGDAPRSRESPGTSSSASPSATNVDTTAPPAIDGAVASSQRLAAAGAESAQDAAPSPRNGTPELSAKLEDFEAVAIGGVSLPTESSHAIEVSGESAPSATARGPDQAARQTVEAVAARGSTDSSAALDASVSLPAGALTSSTTAKSPSATDAPTANSGIAPKGDMDALPMALVDVPVAVAGAAPADLSAAPAEQFPAAVAATRTSQKEAVDVPVAPAAAAVSTVNGESELVDAELETPTSRAQMTSVDATTVQIESVTANSPLSTLAEPELAAHDMDIPLPREIDQPYSQRAPETREELVEKMGGSEETERAVEMALAWLAAHQHADGRWDADGFDRHCGKCGGEAAFDADVATTGLALLCFLAADHSHLKNGPYRDNVNRGVTWLKSTQRDHGDLRRTETMYSHAIATIALAEAYGMTRDESLRPVVEGAVDFMVKAQNKQIGGWRYEPGQAGDTSVLGWVVMGFTSAKRAGIPIPEEVFDAAREWLDIVSSKRDRGLYAYQPGQKHTTAMTAEGLFSQQLLGRKRHETRMIQAAGFLVDNLPDWSTDANSYYLYYGTLAMYQHQGEAWEQWNRAMTREILAHQITSGEAAGSWDPTDRWSLIGGRIYQTALCTLSLEVYYRYLPLYSRLVD